MPAPRLAPRRAPRSVPLAAVVAAVVPLVAVSCETTGPRAIAEGRAVYNDVITRTGDEQVLGIIVKHRYDESFGILDVTAVTSQLHVTAETAINVGAGDPDSYDGNLVPFSAGLTYEEAPTISYVPMSGEALMTRLVAPITLPQALTVGQLSRIPGQTFALMINRVNGINNAPGGGVGESGGPAADFRHVGELLAALQTQGCGDYVSSGDAHYLLLHDYKGAHDDLVRELLQKLRLTAFEADGRELLIPIRSGLGQPPQGDAILVETRSVLDLLRVVGDEIEIPAPHLQAGIVAPAPAPPAGAAAGATPFIRIRSAPERPRDATVAVAHRGWWFYIDATDVASKRDFVLLRAVISMGLESAPQGHLEPVLTLPVGG